MTIKIKERPSNGQIWRTLSLFLSRMEEILTLFYSDRIESEPKQIKTI